MTIRDEERSARRNFMLGALAAIPAATALVACGDPADAAAEDADLALERRAPSHPRERPCIDDKAAHRRARRKQLLDLHMGTENLHDLPGVMGTFSDQGEMLFNGVSYRGASAIAAGHILFGMSDMPGALAGTKVIPEREYYTDDEILVEGIVAGTHVGPVGAFAPTGKQIELHYAAFYRFDENDELISERIVMNWGPLAPSL